MALLTRFDLIGPPQSAERIQKTARVARARLLAEAKAAPIDQTFDIFLSHSTRHAREALAIKRRFESMGFSVYVDWVDDAEMDRSKVTPATAARLRHRITASRSLLVHATEGADLSKWVPWELGYADGLHRPVGVVPVLAENRPRLAYKGVEYLGLYPYVDVAESATTNVPRPWVNRSPSVYVGLRAWLKGREPYRHN